MSVVVIGLQHTQAPLPLLEATAVGDADLHKTLSALSHRRNVQEAVVLSTCLRTEVYAVVDRFHDAVAEIYDVLSDHSGVSVEELSVHAIIRFDDDVTSHLFSVASGLESVVTGETEVVGQVRRAFERAQEEGTCGPVLSALFRHALQTGKRVRTETAISQGTTSFAYAAVTVARGRDGAGLHDARVVVVGAGDMGLGVYRALSELPEGDAPRRVVVVNRSLSRADDVVRDVGGAPFEVRTASLERVAGELADADVVLTAVAAESHVLELEDFSGATGPLRVIDLGVPRNVDPTVAGLDGVSLLDMDTLERVGDPGDRRPPGRGGRRPRHRRHGGRSLPHGEPPARRRADHLVAAGAPGVAARLGARAAPGAVGRPQRRGVGARRPGDQGRTGQDAS